MVGLRTPPRHHSLPFPPDEQRAPLRREASFARRESLKGNSKLPMNMLVTAVRAKETLQPVAHPWK